MSERVQRQASGIKNVEMGMKSVRESVSFFKNIISQINQFIQFNIISIFVIREPIFEVSIRNIGVKNIVSCEYGYKKHYTIGGKKND